MKDYDPLIFPSFDGPQRNLAVTIQHGTGNRVSHVGMNLACSGRSEDAAYVGFPDSAPYHNSDAILRGGHQTGDGCHAIFRALPAA